MFLSARGLVFLSAALLVFHVGLVLGAPSLQPTSNGPAPVYYIPGGASQERYLDAAPESMSPSIPWPEWLPRDTSGLPKYPSQTGQFLQVPYNTQGRYQGQTMPGSMLPSSNPQGGSLPIMLAPSTLRQFPKGDPRNCIKQGDTLNIMQVLPGLGWDNLRNLETGMVTSFSYSQCRVTNDRKYLIPDDTFAIPIKSSVIERNSELIDNWDSYKSSTSRSINAGFDLFGKIGGKFSKEFLDLKSKQYNEKAVTMRMELRHQLHTIRQDPDSRLHPSFKNRLLDILSLLKTNDTTAARYAGQLLIRDYGTHYLISVDAGAVLVKEDNLRSSIISTYNGRMNSITAAGGADFFNVFSLNTGFTQYNGNVDVNEYKNQRTSSKIITYGGPPYRVGMQIADWENGIPNNLVAVDRRGKPIHNIITIDNMKPEVFNPAEVIILKSLVQDVVKQYYDFNTHLGCTNIKAQNFDYQANSPYPGACNASASSSFNLGGVFQMCSYISHGNGLCRKLMQKNPITGGYSCPSGYESVLLLEGTASRPNPGKSCKSVKKCAFWKFRCRREEECQYFQRTERARHQTFWCAPAKKKRQSPTGYLFGGIYSSELNNPITRSRSCPNHYVSMKLGSNAIICLSEDYELGRQFSLPFGGFFSCNGGNKLAAMNATEFLNNPRDWPMRCPMGFTQHLALSENNCRINFCVKAGTLLRAMDLDIVLPPFEPLPGFKDNSTTEIFEVIDPRAIERAYSYAVQDPNNTAFLLAQESNVELNTAGSTTTKDGTVPSAQLNTAILIMLAIFMAHLLQQ